MAIRLLLISLLISFFFGSFGITGEPIVVSSVLISPMQEVKVPARQKGPLTSFDAEEGDLLEAGDRIAVIDDGEARLELSRMRLNLETSRLQAQNETQLNLAKKLLERAKADFERARRTQQNFAGAITEEELHDRQLSVDQATLQIQQAEHELAVARSQLKIAENDASIAEKKLELCQIVSPIHGIIVQVQHRQGEWVDPGTIVVRMLRIDRLRAEGFVPSSVATQLSTGLNVVVSVADTHHDQQEYKGHLRFVSPEINPVDGRVRVWAEIVNTNHQLRPGIRATMNIIVDSQASDPSH